MNPTDLERRLSDTLKKHAEVAMSTTDTENQLASTLASAKRQERARRLMGAAAVVATLAAGLALLIPDLDGRTPDTAGPATPTVTAAPAITPETLAAITATGVPWCLPDPDDPMGELVVGAGPTVSALCSWRHQTHVYFIHQAGATLIHKDFGVWRVADGQLTELGTAPGMIASGPTLSQDGRLAAWITNGTTNCGSDFRLWVYEIATGRQIAATTLELPTSACFHLAPGMDDRGRVYVTTSPGDEPNTHVYMYDTGTSTWTEVTGMPGAQITYVTADGFAVEAEGIDTTSDNSSDHHSLVSVEGVVDADGRFGERRHLPVGSGVWSPDRSMVVDRRPDGVVVRRADDLDQAVTLDVLDRTRGARPLDIGLQWTPDGSVLVWSGGRTNLCDPRSGACQVVSEVGFPASDPFSGRGG